MGSFIRGPSHEIALASWACTGIIKSEFSLTVKSEKKGCSLIQLDRSLYLK